MVLVLEASFIFVCAPPLQKFATYMSEKPTWYKAALYLALGIPSILMCFQLLSIFGSGCIFVTGVFYAAVALGKKASREAMMASARGNPDAQKASLVDDPDLYFLPSLTSGTFHCELCDITGLTVVFPHAKEEAHLQIYIPVLSVFELFRMRAPLEDMRAAAQPTDKRDLVNEGSLPNIWTVAPVEKENIANAQTTMSSHLSAV
ncbi:unnamed protein product, partial [Darwinula stevensoni]